MQYIGKFVIKESTKPRFGGNLTPRIMGSRPTSDGGTGNQAANSTYADNSINLTYPSNGIYNVFGSYGGQLSSLNMPPHSMGLPQNMNAYSSPSYSNVPGVGNSTTPYRQSRTPSFSGVIPGTNVSSSTGIVGNVGSRTSGVGVGSGSAGGPRRDSLTGGSTHGSAGVGMGGSGAGDRGTIGTALLSNIGNLGSAIASSLTSFNNNNSINNASSNSEPNLTIPSNSGESISGPTSPASMNVNAGFGGGVSSSAVNKRQSMVSVKSTGSSGSLGASGGGGAGGSGRDSKQGGAGAGAGGNGGIQKLFEKW
jgi:hypothetical protein